MHARSGAYYAVEQKEMIYPRNCQPRSAERKPPSAGLQPTEVSHLYWRFGFFFENRRSTRLAPREVRALSVSY